MLLTACIKFFLSNTYKIVIFEIARLFELMISEIEKNINPNGEESGGCSIC